VIENVMSRGLLYGRDYEIGPNYRGVWGLYGSYDYLAPQTYHVSSTALSVGTTGQWWMSRSNALQGTAMAGVGYAAASTLKGSDDRDYHYGLAPQAMLALRWIYGDRASLDVTAREYYVSRVGGNRNGHDNIVRTDASFTWRVKGEHGVAIKYLFNRRDASFSRHRAAHPDPRHARGVLRAAGAGAFRRGRLAARTRHPLGRSGNGACTSPAKLPRMTAP
jgi:hypothetical protein